MMNDILRDFISCGVVICYMDDILIYTETLAEHHQVTQEVLATLHHHKLFLKPKKCKFEQQEINYLGLVISCGHIRMDPVKVQGVADWLAPTQVKEIQSFLGFVNFYHQFIWGFSDIAHPLHTLTRKSKKWSWGLPEQKAFKALKTEIGRAHV